MSMDSSSNSIEQKKMNLSALVARRDAKRRQVEALGQEMTAIKRQMDGINTELNALDVEISEAERELMQAQNDDSPSQPSQHISYKKDELDNSAVSTDEEAAPTESTHARQQAMSPGTRLAMTSADEFLTDPAMTANDPGEHLTDPTTQTPANNKDTEARDVEAFYDEDVIPEPLPPPSRSSSLMGQLPITTGKATTAKKSRHNSQKRSSGGGATLDHYFQRTSDVTPSSGEPTPHGIGDSYFESGGNSTTRNSGSLDSLHSLPQPLPAQHQEYHQDRTSYTVARIPQEERHSAYERQLQSDNFPWSGQVRSALSVVFRIESFREQQKEIINCTMNGDDAFVIMRTGGGKSLTYQLPALLEGCGPERKVTLVVSPLLSLIQDQVDQMNAFSPGSATSFTSNMPGGNAEHSRRWNMVRDRHAGICLVFVTPEKVYKSGKLKSELQKLYNQRRLGRFVIDECHCACQWGHDFRPDYTKLGALKTMFPDIPLIAVTATASDRVRDDVCGILRLGRNYQFFRSTANRPNLHYSVVPKVDNKEKVVDEMAAFIKEKHPNNAGIIYTFSRKEADTVADKLCERGIVARAYHSTVGDSAKETIHHSWMRNETQVVVATIAFGLGINKADVRFVLHHSISKSLEAYYQESGRAGRDGKPADCVLYYSTKDVSRMLEMIHGENGEVSFWSMVRYSQASGNDAICRSIILSTLGEPGSEDPSVLLDRYNGVTTETRDVGGHAKTATELLQYKISIGENQTIPMLVKEWRTKPENAAECVQLNPPGQDITSDECSRILVALMVEDILHPNVIYNNKGFANMYLKLGPKAFQLLASPDPKVYVHLLLRKKKKAGGAPKYARKSKTAIPDADGWISTKKNKKATTAAFNKRKRSSSTDKKRKKKTKDSTVSKRKKPATTSKKKKPVKPEIIELSSSSDNESSVELPTKRATSKRPGSLKAPQRQESIWDEPSDSSEYEFDE